MAVIDGAKQQKDEAQRTNTMVAGEKPSIRARAHQKKRPYGARNFLSGYTFIELLIVVGITIVVLGMVVATFGNFSHHQKLSNDASKLLGDLMVAQQFATTQRDGYKYYGLRFYNGLGEKGDRYGYKILRFEPPAGVEPRKMDVSAGDLDISRFTVLKSSVSADNPEFLEDTFFNKGVGFGVFSEFQVYPATMPRRDTIIFIPVGSATSDGLNLLTTTNDRIILESNIGEQSKLVIVPLTGHASIQ